MSQVLADVFVLDDNEDFRFFAQRGVEIFGYSCAVFSTSEAALKALSEAESSPKIIFVDFYMPHTDGAAFISSLRGSPNGPKVKIILSSGIDSIAEKSVALGADGYLKKPFDLQQLKSLLETYLSGR